MLHFGRAIADAPEARFPAERLAAIALDTVTGHPLDPRLASAATRALQRAAEDAPGHVELVEALAALLLRLGHHDEAERRTIAAIAIAPGRARLYALLAQALQARRDTSGALAALQAGLAEAAGDPLLCAARGTILAARGDFDAAAAAWRAALARDPVHPGAFDGLASLALRSRDAVMAQSMVDAALASPRAPPDVLRRAVQLAIAGEGEGLARASRLARLCERLLQHAPDDAPASLVLARSLVVLGERQQARLRLLQIERSVPASASAAEAQVVRLALEDAGAQLELDSVLRAAASAPPDNLTDVATRARRLATLYGAWSGWLAAAVAERRRGRWAAARGALEVALEAAPGAPSVHLEMVSVLIALEDASGAISHAERALTLEGETPRALRAHARALFAAGRGAQAREAITRALQIYPEDEELQALAARHRERQAALGWRRKLSDVWSRLRR
jgi:tetratricopeptide (TPR) repeat protein